LQYYTTTEKTIYDDAALDFGQPWQVVGRRRRFVEHYCKHLNGARAAIEAGYSQNGAAAQASRLLSDVNVKKEVSRRLDKMAMGADEAVKRMSDWGRGSLGPFHRIDDVTGAMIIDLTTPQAQENLHLIKKIKTNVLGMVEEIELHDAKDAVDKILRVRGKYIDNVKFEDVTPPAWDPEKGDPREFVQKQLKQ